MNAPVPVVHANAPIGGKLITPVTVTLGAVVLAMLGVLGVRFVLGLGSVTNLNNGYPWGLWIAWDDVVGSALACGGFATALLVYVLNRGTYHPLMRPALLAALLGFVMAAFSVIADLGRWWNAWHMFVPSYMQPNSVMLEVALCVVGYTMVLMLEAAPPVLERFGWKTWQRRLNKALFVIVGLGVLLPTMHQSSLGMLLVIFGPQIHPLYQTKLLPLLFLSSTLGMGYAAVTIEAAIESTGLRRPFEKEILSKLLQVGRLVMGLFLLLRFGDLLYRGAMHYAFEWTWPAFTFWVETALSSVPLWLLPKSRAQSGRFIFLSAMAMALAGILYRLSAYLVAYETGAGWHYFPSVGEMTVTAGLIAAEALAIIIAVKLLPILPAEPAPRSSS